LVEERERERERAPFLAFCVEDKGETGVHRMKKISLAQPSL